MFVLLGGEEETESQLVLLSSSNTNEPMNAEFMAFLGSCFFNDNIYGELFYVFNLKMKNLLLHKKVLFVLSHKLVRHICCNRDIKYLSQ